MPRNPRSASSQRAGASSRLRERVLGSVRGEPPNPPAQPGGRRPRALVAVLGLLVGLILGAGLVLAFSSNSGSHTGARAPIGLRATLRRLGSRAELEVAGMPEPPIGEVYEVWLLRSKHPRPEATDALFTVTSAGSATVDVPAGASRDVREVMVTSEPLGGSTSPTGPAVLRVRASGTV